MYTNPQIGGNRQRDLLARAEQQRRAQRFRGRHLGRALMARLRTVMPRTAPPAADAEASGDSPTG
jgi:hypothetical protein